LDQLLKTYQLIVWYTLERIQRDSFKQSLRFTDDGLDITVQILAEAGHYLSPEGILVVEVGNSGEQLEALFPEIHFDWVEFERGGFGVFVINSAELEAYKPMFEDVYNSRQGK
jgi:ribosomal protein L3 glutamine methyltransferase